MSEHKPLPAAQSKVHDLARRYSALAKQSGGGIETLSLPQEGGNNNNRARGGSFGRTEGSKVSGLLGKYKESTQAAATTLTSAGNNLVGRFTSSKEKDAQLSKQEHMVMVEEEYQRSNDNEGENQDLDYEKEIESTLKVSELNDRRQEMDLVDVPLSNNQADIAEEEEEETDGQELSEEQNEDQGLDKNLMQKVRAMEHEEHEEQLEHETEAADEALEA